MTADFMLRRERPRPWPSRRRLPLALADGRAAWDRREWQWIADLRLSQQYARAVRVRARAASRR